VDIRNSHVLHIGMYRQPLFAADFKIVAEGIFNNGTIYVVLLKVIIGGKHWRGITPLFPAMLDIMVRCIHARLPHVRVLFKIPVRGETKKQMGPFSKGI